MFLSTSSLLLLSLSLITRSTAATIYANSVIVTLKASDYFPDAKGDLTKFNIDAQYFGYNTTAMQWLASLDPASGTGDKEKAVTMIEAAYAKPFDENDTDMTEDVNTLLAAITGTTTERSIAAGQDSSSFVVSSAHAVKWSVCAGVFSCLSGTSCSLSINIGQAPRSACQQQGSSNCCISWSDYNVRALFFSATFTVCDQEVDAMNLDMASCEGYGSSAQGGDVCLSNRANGCT